MMATHGFCIGNTTPTLHFVCFVEMQVTANHIRIFSGVQKCSYSKVMSKVVVKHSLVFM